MEIMWAKPNPPCTVEASEKRHEALDFRPGDSTYSRVDSAVSIKMAGVSSKPNKAC